jgi:hypothetical protein
MSGSPNILQDVLGLANIRACFRPPYDNRDTAWMGHVYARTTHPSLVSEASCLLPGTTASDAAAAILSTRWKLWEASTESNSSDAPHYYSSVLSLWGRAKVPFSAQDQNEPVSLGGQCDCTLRYRPDNPHERVSTNPQRTRTIGTTHYRHGPYVPDGTSQDVHAKVGGWISLQRPSEHEENGAAQAMSRWRNSGPERDVTGTTKALTRVFAENVQRIHGYAALDVANSTLALEGQMPMSKLLGHGATISEKDLKWAAYLSVDMANQNSPAIDSRTYAPWDTDHGRFSSLHV